MVINGFVKFVDSKIVEVNGELYIVDYIFVVVGGCFIIFNILGVEFGIDLNGFFELNE